MGLSSLKHLPKGEIEFISCISSCCMINVRHGGGFCDLDHDCNPRRTLLHNFLIGAPQLSSVEVLVTLCSFLTFNQVTERKYYTLKS